VGFAGKVQASEREKLKLPKLYYFCNFPPLLNTAALHLGMRNYIWAMTF
jgi:hypothetical protein